MLELNNPVSERPSLGIPVLSGVKSTWGQVLLIMLLVSQAFGNILCKPISEGKRKWKPNKKGSHLDMQNFKVSLRLRGI